MDPSEGPKTLSRRKNRKQKRKKNQAPLLGDEDETRQQMTNGNNNANFRPPNGDNNNNSQNDFWPGDYDQMGNEPLHMSAQGQSMSPLLRSPPTPMPQPVPGAPTQIQAHALPGQHSHQNSITSRPPTPSTAATRLNTNARRVKVTLKNPDGTEIKEEEAAKVREKEAQKKQKEQLSAKADAEADIQAKQADEVTDTLTSVTKTKQPASLHIKTLIGSATGKDVKKKLRPSPLDLSYAKNAVAPLPIAVPTARMIDDLGKVSYPEGVSSPKVELNVGAKDGKFRYDRDFLLQFMSICKEKPDSLPPLDAIGLGPVEQDPGYPLVRPSRRPASGINYNSLGKAEANPFNHMGGFTISANEMSSEERFNASGSQAGGMPFGRPTQLHWPATTNTQQPLPTELLGRRRTEQPLIDASDDQEMSDTSNSSQYEELNALSDTLHVARSSEQPSAIPHTQPIFMSDSETDALEGSLSAKSLIKRNRKMPDSPNVVSDDDGQVRDDFMDSVAKHAKEQEEHLRVDERVSAVAAELSANSKGGGRARSTWPEPTFDDNKIDVKDSTSDEQVGIEDDASHPSEDPWGLNEPTEVTSLQPPQDLPLTDKQGERHDLPKAQDAQDMLLDVLRMYEDSQKPVLVATPIFPNDSPQEGPAPGAKTFDEQASRNIFSSGAIQELGSTSDPSSTLFQRRRRAKQRLKGFDAGGDPEVISESESSEYEEYVTLSEHSPLNSIRVYPNDNGTFEYIQGTLDEYSPTEIEKDPRSRQRSGFVSRCITYGSSLPTHIRLQPFSQVTVPAAPQPATRSSPLYRWAEVVFCCFTLYGPLCNASALPDPVQKREHFNRVFTKLQSEWMIVAGLLVALMAIDVAVFAIPSGPDAMLKIDQFALNAILTSFMASAIGLACTAWFLVRYNGTDLDTFISRAQGLFSTYFFFALSSRFPALLMATSVLSILIFLARVAYTAWPIGTLVFGIFSVALVTLEYWLYGVMLGIGRFRALVARS